MNLSEPLVAILESLNPLDRRIPIHPVHFNCFEKKNVFVQQDYAQLFGETDETLSLAGFGVMPREVLLEKADIIFVLKPTPKDLLKVKRGAAVIGWCHAVQQLDIAAIAIERNLTLIAMEEMYIPTLGGGKQHLFYENNFMAGYVGVEHALETTSIVYPKNANISVITYGIVSQGAVSRLLAMGFSNITVYSRRSLSAIVDRKNGVVYRKLIPHGNKLLTTDGVALSCLLSKSDIIINGIMQNVLNPYLFLTRSDLCSFQNKLIIDISCDDHMGFDFACATTIDNPTIKIGENYYYAVENIPAIQWRSISVPISEKLSAILKELVVSTEAFPVSPYIKSAVVINKGIVFDRNITEYQQQFKLVAEA